MVFFNHETKIFTSERFPRIWDSEVPVGQVLLYQFHKIPTKVLQINADNGEELTAGEISLRMRQIAVELMDFDLKFGDVAGFCGKSTTYMAPTVFSCLLLGLPVNPLLPKMTSEAIAEDMRKSKPKVVFCDADQVEKIVKALEIVENDAKIITLTEKVPGYDCVTDFFDISEGRFVEIPKTFGIPTKDVVATILPSSGSTGVPKLIQVSQAQLLETHAAVNGFHDNGLMTNYFDLYWILGLATMVTTALNQQPRLITNQIFSPESCLRIIEKFKISQAMLGPSDITAVIEFLGKTNEKFDLSSIKIMETGGWFISEDTVATMEKFLPNGKVMPMYGMTEVVGVISRNDLKGSKSSVGKLCANTDAKILMEDGSLGGIGDLGEILIKRDQNIVGYLNETHRFKQLIDSEGWIHTGDMGHFDEDLNLHISGRKTFAIRSSHHVVFPTELEEVIEKVPGVAAVCVVTAPSVDIDEYFVPGALVVKSADSKLTERDIEKSVEHLEDFKHLKAGVIFDDNLPKTPSGKVQRFVAEKIFLTKRGMS